MKKVVSLAVASALLAVQPASAQDAEVYRPDTAWAMDYGDDYCLLMRDFTNGEDTVGLLFERIQPGPMFRLFVVGDSVRLFRGADQIGYRTLPSGSPRMAPRVVMRAVDGQQLLNLGPTALADMPMPAPGAPPAPPRPYTRDGEKAAGANVTGLLLQQGVTRPIRIETGSMEAPIAALQACADDMLNVWGLDVEAHQSLQRPALPAGPTAGWIQSNTVPFSEFTKLSGGNNEFRVMVDASGSPTSCHVHNATLEEAANDDVCNLILENGEFMPALDSSGQPIDSYWMTNVFMLTPPFGG